ncbi:unnamed protein product [Tilletia controversa]|uniref:Uncharacterized protein n=1 Tax=Tilletia controversa TaxID=13291 RepID=A0A8X7MQV4_9BASI|nr:hypothetical protein CF328_g4651 [Tilletia controversa]KAE8245723.1 hypothetical protein A4X06_0g5461 [Tilletia controversa]CAD6910294.1 unnamed protein product [Tilletia controversa]CAD6937078.1 unnamed protein product [Tilletia controversa]CAD6985397.1 unnamed protein product [Tilletia controversa]
MTAPTERIKLTPIQRHYLVTALSQMQMQKEWGHLERLGALTKFGNPFSHERPVLKRLKAELDKTEKGYIDRKNVEDDTVPAGDADLKEDTGNLECPESPLLRHLFHCHLRTVPGLDEAPDTYFSQRWQPLFDEAALRNFSHSAERAEMSKRRFYPILATRYLGAFVARGVGIRADEGELRGPGPGDPGTEAWDVGKKWGAGTCKRGLAHPVRIDDVLMAKIDGLFDGAEGEAWKRAGAETKRVHGAWQQWKEDVIENETGLERTFNQLDISNIKNLPPNYRSAAEYARNFAAEWMRYFVVVQPGADELFSALKIIHMLFPYWGAIQLLRVANAQKVIAGILAILLARPGGTPSLIQRIVSAVVGSQAKALEKKLIKPLRQVIGDSRITQAVDAYVNRGSWTEKAAVKKEAQEGWNDILTVILLRAQALPEEETMEMQQAFITSPLLSDIELAYPPSCLHEDERRPPPVLNATNGPLALKFAQSKLYLRNVLKKRDREQVVAMSNSSLIPATIKDTLNAVFYKAISTIAKHANLAARLGDLQAFNNDAIHVRSHSLNTRADWIALAARHENSLFLFFHEMASIIAPLAEWTQYGVDYMALSTTDPLHPDNDAAERIEVNVEDLMAQSGLSPEENKKILDEVDALSTHVLYSKVRIELETRRTYLSALPDAVPPSGLSRADVPTESMRQRIEDVDSLLAELMQAEGIQREDGTCRSSARGTEAHLYPWAYFDQPDPTGQQLTRLDVDGEKSSTPPPPPRFEPTEVSAPIPSMPTTRKLLPAWTMVLERALPNWEDAVKNEPGRPGAASDQEGGSGGGGGGRTGLGETQTDAGSSVYTSAGTVRSKGGISRLFGRQNK